MQLEHDFQGSDYSMYFKALNPSPTNLTGIYVANYLQTLTPRFALGAEAVYQHPSPEIEEATVGLGLLTPEEVDAQVRPELMIGPNDPPK